MKPALIALLVALIWGLNPIFEKLSLKGASPLSAITIRFVFTAICLSVFVLATGRAAQVVSVDGRTLFWILLSGVLGGIIGIFLYFTALQMSDASRIVPIIATFPMFTAVYAYLLLGESPGPARILGIALIVVGSVLIETSLFSD